MAGPMDKLVTELANNKHLLTEDNLRAISDALFVPSDLDLDGEVATLKQMLVKQMALFTRLSNMTQSSTDPAVIQRVLASSQQMMAMLVKYQDQAQEQDRHAQVESAMVDALNELGDVDVKNRYLVLLAEALKKRASQ